MTPAPRPILHFYRRAACEPCDEARATLQQVLEDRVRRGDPIPRIRYVDLAEAPDLETSYGALVPVLEVGVEKLSLTVSYSSISTFLDRVIGRAA